MATLDLHINNANRLIETLIMDIAKDIESLLNFSYELLKYDYEQEHVY